MTGVQTCALPISSVVSKVAFAMTVVWKIQSNILPLIQVSTYRFLNGIGGGGVHLVF